jgi:hypothetical protein
LRLPLTGRIRSCPSPLIAAVGRKACIYKAIWAPNFLCKATFSTRKIKHKVR